MEGISTKELNWVFSATGLPSSFTCAIDGIYRKHHLFRKQFVADASDVQDLDAGIFGEAVMEAGDEDLEAAGVEEVVIAPEDRTKASERSFSGANWL